MATGKVTNDILNKDENATNCNDDMPSGAYQITSSSQNSPSGVGVLFNLNCRGGRRLQVIVATTHQYYRYYSGSEWSAWREVQSSAVS